MTVREWLSSLDDKQLAGILEELKHGKYDNDNLDFNFAIRYQKILPCLNERNSVYDWLHYQMEDLP